MNAHSVAEAAYIVAALLFILSLAGLSRHETAKHGIVYGIAGMAIALAATIGEVAVTAVALALGWHLVASIGGGDMPVVVSMLNSYSGWAAAASGFLLDNNLLIITGALVGSSGAYLSYIMCKAMNRSFLSVIAGGFGNEGHVSATGEQGVHTEITAAEVADLLADASSVIITP